MMGRFVSFVRRPPHFALTKISLDLVLAVYFRPEKEVHFRSRSPALRLPGENREQLICRRSVSGIRLFVDVTSSLCKERSTLIEELKDDRSPQE